jgi:hypothetical protein
MLLEEDARIQLSSVLFFSLLQNVFILRSFLCFSDFKILQLVQSVGLFLPRDDLNQVVPVNLRVEDFKVGLKIEFVEQLYYVVGEVHVENPKCLFLGGVFREQENHVVERYWPNIRSQGLF